LWQRDALCRLVLNGELTESDVQELAKILKKSKGIAVGKEPVPVPQPLAQSHLPTAVEGKEAVTLLGIRHVSNVNALAPDQTLGFSSSGMTVVYGDNGSGKSGYARILRRACRARSRGESILQNVFNSGAGDSPQATIDYQVGVSQDFILWREGVPPPAVLSQVSFFDAKCATVHVGSANELAFTPLGLDLPRKLVEEGCHKIRALLNGEKAPLELGKPQSLREPRAEPGTAVRQAVDGISATSTLERYKDLAELAEEERERKRELEKALASDPVSAAKELAIRLGRLKHLQGVVKEVQTALSDVNVELLERTLAELKAKQKAARVAAEEAFTGQPLEHVGSEIWRKLWEAARRYSEAEAYPGRSFPVVETGARCVLCQQSLSDDASRRLTRFEEFIREDTQRSFERANREFENMCQRVQIEDLARQTYKDALSDLALENEDLLQTARDFLASAHRRMRVLCRASAKRAWVTPSPLASFAIARLSDLCVSISARVESLTAAAQSEGRQRLQNELCELKAKQWLSEVLDDVGTEIKRLRTLKAIEAAVVETGTTQITNFSSELTDRYVTDALCKRFVDEVRELGAAYLRIKLDSAGGEYGQKRFQVFFEGVEHAANVPMVLSEGEFCCVALAGFLAELATAPSKSGLVLDDPVCSLDHQWRRRVAERLVKEAAGRQVVIFTHDIVFLLDLVELSERHGVELAQYHLERGCRGVGVCMDGVPWGAMKVRTRIGLLKDRQQQAEFVFRNRGYAAYEPLAHDIYDLLRGTWERAVEEVLLNGAVMRFQRGIHTQQLRKLNDITPDDYDSIDEGMTKASRFIRSHDLAPAVNEPVPAPDELRDDIEKLDGWVGEVRKRRQ